MALPIELVQEVVNYPERVTPVPLAPSFFMGLFNLRGMIVPIINLNELLNLPPQTDFSQKKIAITTYQDIKVGMIFDSTSEILKIHEDEAYQENISGGVIKGILKLNQGDRLLQVIDVENLIKLENFPHIMSKIRLASASEQETKNRQKKKQSITFSVNDFKMAFAMEDIVEIIKVPELQKSHVNYPFSRGLVNLRGMMIPVVDLGHFLSRAPKREVTPEELSHKRIIFLGLAEGFKLGVLIDSVEAIVPYFENDVLPVHNLDEAQQGFFKGLLTEDILFMNTDFFLEHPEIGQTIKGHAKLYQNVTTQTKKKMSGKETFISFMIDTEFCFPILDIKEVIEFPQNVTRPIGSPAHLVGIYNLRGHAITLISLKAGTSFEKKKVIILKLGDDHVGLVVDSVENIFSVFAEDKFPCPGLMKDTMDVKLSRVIREFILLNDGETIKNKRLVVLDSKRFFDPETYKAA